MDERQKLMMEISVLIGKLKETDIYSLEGSMRVDLTTSLNDVDTKIDFMISRLEKLS